MLGVVACDLAELKALTEHAFVNAAAVYAGEVVVKAYVVRLCIGLHRFNGFVYLSLLIVGELDAVCFSGLAEDEELLRIFLRGVHEVVVPCAVAAAHLL